MLLGCSRAFFCAGTSPAGAQLPNRAPIRELSSGANKLLYEEPGRSNSRWPEALGHAQDQLASLRGVNSPLKVNSLGRGDVLRENIGNPVFLAVPDSPLWSMSSLAVVRCYGS